MINFFKKPPESSKGPKPPSPTTRRPKRQALYPLVVAGLTLLSPSVTEAFSLKKALSLSKEKTTKVAGELINQALEEQYQQQQARQLEKETLKINEGYLHKLAEMFQNNERFAVESKVGYYPWNFDEIAKGIIGQIVQEVFSLTQVPNLKELQEIEKRRKQIRKLKEVKEEQVPPPGTVLVPQITVQLESIKQFQDFKSLSLWLRTLPLPKDLINKIFSSIGIYEQKKTTITVLTINIINEQTGEKVPIITIGSEKDQTYLGVYIQGWWWRQYRQTTGRRKLNSLLSALESFKTLLEKAKQELTKEIYPFKIAGLVTTREGKLIGVHLQLDQPLTIQPGDSFNLYVEIPNKNYRQLIGILQIKVNHQISLSPGIIHIGTERTGQFGFNPHPAFQLEIKENWSEIIENFNKLAQKDNLPRPQIIVERAPQKTN